MELCSRKRVESLFLAVLLLSSSLHCQPSLRSSTVPEKEPETQAATHAASETELQRDVPKLYASNSWIKQGPVWIVGPGLTLIPSDLLSDYLATLELTTNELDKVNHTEPVMQEPVRSNLPVWFVPVVCTLGGALLGGVCAYCAK